MRRKKTFIGEFKMSFLSPEKDTETILRKLFVESYPYSDKLKRLLMINTEDCLTDETNQAYIDKINVGVDTLIKEGYIRTSPKLRLDENNEVQNYIMITYDNFLPTGNDHYRDCFVSFEIICNTEYWALNEYKLRPISIAGYIDGLLDGIKLSGIGTLEFVSMNQTVLSESLTGYTLTYRTVHGKTEDKNPDTFGLSYDD